MPETEIARLDAKIEAHHQQYEERFARVCQNQKELYGQVQQLLGLFRGIKKAIWGAGALAGTVGGLVFQYMPEVVKFLDHALNST